MPETVKMNFFGLYRNMTRRDTAIVVLKEEAGEKKIAFNIGAHDSETLLMFVENIRTERPYVHDVLINVLDRLGIHIEEVRIIRIVNGIFRARLIFYHNGEEQRIRIRISDAVALALRMECPIYATQAVINDAGTSLPDIVVQKAEKEAAEKEEFHIGTDRLKQMTEDELKELLKRALDREAYEEATRIRDELLKRKSKL
jgi:bifunctional DNase/RNase